ncbi:MAG: DNA gyrase inhibitor YacG [Pseudomonadales bacterium]|nr:DNA gyrase inhibitor YacG [Pseudomonadales bacterium]
MKIKCPTCQKEQEWSEDNQYRPFCSDRCRLIDLGEWASENHKISSPIGPIDEFDEELENLLSDEDRLH